MFIALEGIDGSGKSTQIKLIEKLLRESGRKVYTTCEPTTDRIGSIIRDILRHKMEADIRTVASLFVADRLEHLLNKENGILKKIADGYVVISDRYYFSSYAYQGAHAGMDWVIQMNEVCRNILKPDINIFIDIPVEVSLQRINTSRQATELYENIENLNKVKDAYFESFNRMKEDEKIFLVDGTKKPEEITQDIINRIKRI